MELIIFLDKKPHLIKNLSTMYELLKLDGKNLDSDENSADQALIA
jgi:hypothetical protein